MLRPGPHRARDCTILSLAPEPSPGASYEAPKLPYLEASWSLPEPRGQYHLDRIVAPIKMLKSASPDLSRGPSYDLFLVSSESLGGSGPADTTSSEQISRPYPRPTKPPNSKQNPTGNRLCWHFGWQDLGSCAPVWWEIVLGSGVQNWASEIARFLL